MLADVRFPLRKSHEAKGSKIDKQTNTGKAVWKEAETMHLRYLLHNLPTVF